jgi:hypothetical protein
VNTNPIGGAVGLAVNGVAIFGNADAEDRDAFVYECKLAHLTVIHPAVPSHTAVLIPSISISNATIIIASTFDTCMGHPQQDGVYHYHCEPTTGCVFNDTAGSHSPLFGVMADGIPMWDAFCIIPLLSCRMLVHCVCVNTLIVMVL